MDSDEFDNNETADVSEISEPTGERRITALVETLDEFADMVACLVIDLQGLVTALANSQPDGRAMVQMEPIRIALGEVMLRAERLELQARRWLGSDFVQVPGSPRD